MPAETDFIIVGAGQNQLTTAAYLAKAGASVLVLEKSGHIGGGVASAQVTAPGFIHDLHATNLFVVQANPLLKHDELGLLSTHGLKFAKTDDIASHGTVFDDGVVIALHTDVERSCASIAAVSPQDAQAYRAFIARTSGLMRLLEFALFLPPAEPRTFISVLNSSEEGRDMLALFNARGWQLIETTFSHPRVRIHLLRFMTELMLDPLAPGTAFGLLFMLGLYHRYPCGFAVGGSQALADALVCCLTAHGGQVETRAHVRQVTLERGRAVGVELADGRRLRASRAIIAGIPPWTLAEFVPGTEMVTHRAKQVPTCDYTVFVSHLALAEAPRPICDAAHHRMGFTVLAPSDPERLLASMRDVVAGRLPAAFSATYVCATNQDPSRAPPGQHTLYLYHTVPNQLAGKTMEDWEAQTESFGNWMIEQARAYIPNLTEANILGVTHESPYWISQSSPSYQRGDVSGLGMFPDQFIFGRPNAELAQYRVPGVDGLYLCGPFMHPGGGANGGGRAVAIRVMSDLRMDLNAVFRL
jgi:phytoene dehydrogenase-like protein